MLRRRYNRKQKMKNMMEKLKMDEISKNSLAFLVFSKERRTKKTIQLFTALLVTVFKNRECWTWQFASNHKPLNRTPTFFF